MSASTPVVSVLMPCFDAARWLPAAIASVRAQRFDGAIEIICVDDGSRDETPAVLASLAGPDLTVIRQDNRGQSAALNVALAAARGDYIQFLDADDLLHPDKIAAQHARLRDAPGAVSVSAWSRFHDDPAEARFVPAPCWQDGAPLDWLARAWHDGGGMLFPARWLIPRAIATAVGGWDEALTVHNDGDYFTRVVLASRAVLHVDAARAYYRSGVAGSVSGRRDARALASYHRSLVQMTRAIEAAPAHEGVRRGLALMWQRVAYACHPYVPALADDAMRRARALHPARLAPEGGWRYRWLAALLGWRAARRLQVWSGRA